jgi:hypothetical protein
MSEHVWFAYPSADARAIERAIMHLSDNLNLVAVLLALLVLITALDTIRWWNR